MAQPGWYTDPYDPSRLRYWDGAQWTEHTHDPVPAVDATSSPAVDQRPVDQHPPMQRYPAAGQRRVPEPEHRPSIDWTGAAGRDQPSREPQPVPAPAGPSPDPGPAPASSHHEPQPGQQPPFTPASPTGAEVLVPGQLGDIGTWLRRSFSVGLRKLLPCWGLAMLGLLPSLLVFPILGLGFGSSMTTGNGGDVALVALIVVILWIAIALWSAVIILAQNHLLHEAHLDRPTSFTRSLQAGIQGLPRLVMAYLVLIVYAIAAAMVVGLIVAALAFISESLIVPALALFYLAFIVLMTWIGVRLLFLFPAAAVAPEGVRPFPTSVDLTSGRFWALFGRMLLLGVVFMVAMIPLLFVVGAALAVTVSAADPLGAADTGVSLAPLFTTSILLNVVVAALQVLAYSAIVRLYVELGGPDRSAPAARFQPPIGA